MKRIFASLCTLLFLASADGQTLPPNAHPSSTPHKHSLSLEAQSVATGGASRLVTDTKNHYDSARTTEGGSVPVVVTQLHDEQQTNNSANLRVAIHNLGTAPDAIKLEWYFFAFPVGATARATAAKELVFDQGSQDVTLAGGETKTCPVASKPIGSVISRSATLVNGADSSTAITFGGLPTSSQQGLKLKGWCVRLMDNGQVLAARGSSQNYEDLAKDDAKLRALIGKQ